MENADLQTAAARVGGRRARSVGLGAARSGAGSAVRVARQAAELARPLVELMKRQVLNWQAVQTDDTLVPVLDPELAGTWRGRFWTYVGGAAHPYTVYDYTPRRSRDGPEVFLMKFRGPLLADAYSDCDQ